MSPDCAAKNEAECPVSRVTPSGDSVIALEFKIGALRRSRPSTLEGGPWSKVNCGRDAFVLHYFSGTASGCFW